MKSILMLVPHPLYADFKRIVLKELVWTESMWQNRLSGRTELKPCEEKCMKQIIDTLVKIE